MIAPDATPLGTRDDAFRERFDAQSRRLRDVFTRLYGDHPDAETALDDTLARATASWNARPLDLKVHDSRRLSDPGWMSSERMLGGACYVDRYGGNLAGIRDQISYFRELGLTMLHLMPLFAQPEDGDDRDEAANRPRVDPSLGSIAQLTDLAADLRLSGIALVLDVPLSRGERAATAPSAFAALADDILFVAERGVGVLRIDPTPFGDDAEAVLQGLHSVLAIAAPATALMAAAGERGDLAALAPDACLLADDPVPSALTWEALATRDARLLQRGLDHRPAPPEGTARVTHVRSADAVRWTFADTDAAELGLDPHAHRRFLNEFYTGRFDGSFARGVPFPAGDDLTAASAVAGTTASLAGIEAEDPAGEDRVILAHALALSAGGVPMLWLGDEVAQLNDPTCADDPERRDDSRWVHRGNRPRDRYAQRHDESTVAGRVNRRMTKLLSVRSATPEFAGGALLPFHTPHASVVGYQRPGEETVVLVLANVGDQEVTIDPLTLSGFERSARDIVRDSDVDLDDGVRLAPHGFTWLRVTPV